jgi:glutamyl-tRNA synthetase
MKVRFAPSPTGFLHVGNARIALANALVARHSNATFLLRLDDTDNERSRPEFAAAIEQDLTWLGIVWDETFAQSERLAAYEEAADRLKKAGVLYPCFESEEELSAKREMAIKLKRAPVYDRAMLKLTPEQRERAEAGGKKPYWRFRLADGEIHWNDLVLGKRAVKLGAVSDPVLIRTDGTPLYTFTSAVDDLFSGVTHIIRGEDHVTNTGVQIDLMRALGGNPAAINFAHLPLLVDQAGGKLSKRLEGLSLRSLRQDGMEPASLVAYLARLGSSRSPELLPLDVLAATYELAHVSRSPARFDMTQLLRLNRHALHAATYESVRDRLPAGATEEFWNAVRGNLDLLTEARHWWDVVSTDIPPPVIEGEANYLIEALELLPPEPWSGDTWAAWTRQLRDSTGRTGKALFRPLRLALTGEEHGPELATLLPMIGHRRASTRLHLASL